MMCLFNLELKLSKIDSINDSINDYNLLKILIIIYQKVHDFVSWYIIRKTLYSFYIKIFCANMIKFCTSNKKMFDSKRFVTRNAEWCLFIFFNL